MDRPRRKAAAVALAGIAAAAGGDAGNASSIQQHHQNDVGGMNKEGSDANDNNEDSLEKEQLEFPQGEEDAGNEATTTTAKGKRRTTPRKSTSPANKRKQDEEEADEEEPQQPTSGGKSKPLSKKPSSSSKKKKAKAAPKAVSAKKTTAKAKKSTTRKNTKSPTPAAAAKQQKEAAKAAAAAEAAKENETSATIMDLTADDSKEDPVAAADAAEAKVESVVKTTTKGSRKRSPRGKRNQQSSAIASTEKSTEDSALASSKSASDAATAAEDTTLRRSKRRRGSAPSSEKPKEPDVKVAKPRQQHQQKEEEANVESQPQQQDQHTEHPTPSYGDENTTTSTTVQEDLAAVMMLTLASAPMSSKKMGASETEGETRPQNSGEARRERDPNTIANTAASSLKLKPKPRASSEKENFQSRKTRDENLDFTEVEISAPLDIKDVASATAEVAEILTGLTDSWTTGHSRFEKQPFVVDLVHQESSDGINKSKPPEPHELGKPETLAAEELGEKMSAGDSEKESGAEEMPTEHDDSSSSDVDTTKPEERTTTMALGQSLKLPDDDPKLSSDEIKTIVASEPLEAEKADSRSVSVANNVKLSEKGGAEFSVVESKKSNSPMTSTRGRRERSQSEKSKASLKTPQGPVASKHSQVDEETGAEQNQGQVEQERDQSHGDSDELSGKDSELASDDEQRSSEMNASSQDQAERTSLILDENEGSIVDEVATSSFAADAKPQEQKRSREKLLVESLSISNNINEKPEKLSSQPEHTPFNQDEAEHTSSVKAAGHSESRFADTDVIDTTAPDPACEEKADESETSSRSDDKLPPGSDDNDEEAVKSTAEPEEETGLIDCFGNKQTVDPDAETKDYSKAAGAIPSESIVSESNKCSDAGNDETVPGDVGRKGVFADTETDQVSPEASKNCTPEIEHIAVKEKERPSLGVSEKESQSEQESSSGDEKTRLLVPDANENASEADADLGFSGDASLETAKLVENECSNVLFGSTKSDNIGAGESSSHRVKKSNCSTETTSQITTDGGEREGEANSLQTSHYLLDSASRCEDESGNEIESPRKGKENTTNEQETVIMLSQNIFAESASKPTSGTSSKENAEEITMNDSSLTAREHVPLLPQVEKSGLSTGDGADVATDDVDRGEDVRAKPLTASTKNHSDTTRHEDVAVPCILEAKLKENIGWNQASVLDHLEVTAEHARRIEAGEATASRSRVSESESGAQEKTATDDETTAEAKRELIIPGNVTIEYSQEHVELTGSCQKYESQEGAQIQLREVPPQNTGSNPKGIGNLDDGCIAELKNTMSDTQQEKSTTTAPTRTDGMETDFSVPKEPASKPAEYVGLTGVIGTTTPETSSNEHVALAKSASDHSKVVSESTARERVKIEGRSTIEKDNSSLKNTITETNSPGDAAKQVERYEAKDSDRRHLTEEIASPYESWLDSGEEALKDFKSKKKIMEMASPELVPGSSKPVPTNDSKTQANDAALSLERSTEPPTVYDSTTENKPKLVAAIMEAVPGYREPIPTNDPESKAMEIAASVEALPLSSEQTSSNDSEITGPLETVIASSGSTPTNDFKSEIKEKGLEELAKSFQGSSDLIPEIDSKPEKKATETDRPIESLPETCEPTAETIFIAENKATEVAEPTESEPNEQIQEDESKSEMKDVENAASWDFVLGSSKPTSTNDSQPDDQAQDFAPSLESVPVSSGPVEEYDHESEIKSENKAAELATHVETAPGSNQPAEIDSKSKNKTMEAAAPVESAPGACELSENEAAETTKPVASRPGSGDPRADIDTKSESKAINTETPMEFAIASSTKAALEYVPEPENQAAETASHVESVPRAPRKTAAGPIPKFKVSETASRVDSEPGSSEPAPEYVAESQNRATDTAVTVDILLRSSKPKLEGDSRLEIEPTARGQTKIESTMGSAAGSSQPTTTDIDSKQEIRKTQVAAHVESVAESSEPTTAEIDSKLEIRLTQVAAHVESVAESSEPSAEIEPKREIRQTLVAAPVESVAGSSKPIDSKREIKPGRFAAPVESVVGSREPTAKIDSKREIEPKHIAAVQSVAGPREPTAKMDSEREIKPTNTASPVQPMAGSKEPTAERKSSVDVATAEFSSGVGFQVSTTTATTGGKVLITAPPATAKSTTDNSKDTDDPTLAAGRRDVIAAAEPGESVTMADASLSKLLMTASVTDAGKVVADNTASNEDEIGRDNDNNATSSASNESAVEADSTPSGSGLNSKEVGTSAHEQMQMKANAPVERVVEESEILGMDEEPKTIITIQDKYLSETRKVDRRETQQVTETRQEITDDQLGSQSLESVNVSTFFDARQRNTDVASAQAAKLGLPETRNDGSLLLEDREKSPVPENISQYKDDLSERHEAAGDDIFCAPNARKHDDCGSGKERSDVMNSGASDVDQANISAFPAYADGKTGEKGIDSGKTAVGRNIVKDNASCVFSPVGESAVTQKASHQLVDPIGNRTGSREETSSATPIMANSGTNIMQNSKIQTHVLPRQMPDITTKPDITAAVASTLDESKGATNTEVASATPVRFTSKEPKVARDTAADCIGGSKAPDPTEAHASKTGRVESKPHAEVALVIGHEAASKQTGEFQLVKPETPGKKTMAGTSKNIAPKKVHTSESGLSKRKDFNGPLGTDPLTLASTPKLEGLKSGAGRNATSGSSIVAAPSGRSADSFRKRKLTEPIVSQTPTKRYRDTANIGFEGRSSPLSDFEQTKLRLYAEGAAVHNTRTYDKEFGDYWDAMRMQFDGGRSVENSTKCKSVINGFLKTRRLRKLHNKLIKVLIRKSMTLCIPFDEISTHLPNSWRKRITIFDRTMEQPSKMKKKEFFITDKLGYLPTIGGAPAYPRKVKCAAHSSLRIPGALSIDPEMRAAVQAADMNVSEEAIWLMIVSAKEYASTILRGCLALKKSVHNGKLKRVLSPGPSPSLGRPEKMSKKDTSLGSSDLPLHERTINPIDVHCFVASLRSGSVHSQGGIVSRIAFERTMMASAETSHVPFAPAFHQIKEFMHRKLAPTYATVVHFQQETTPTASSASETRKPTSSGGLGRGAKDLAALKKRSSSRQEGESMTDMSERGSESSRQSRVLDSADPLGTSTRTTTSVPSTSVPSSSRSTPAAAAADSKQLEDASPARRGKGFGIKDLAALRARSAANQKDDSS
ncbi:hypothetical protein ACA910_007809 [Epithemia clementina (nom. ined.)]